MIVTNTNVHKNNFVTPKWHKPFTVTHLRIRPWPTLTSSICPYHLKYECMILKLKRLIPINLTNNFWTLLKIYFHYNLITNLVSSFVSALKLNISSNHQNHTSNNITDTETKDPAGQSDMKPGVLIAIGILVGLVALVLILCYCFPTEKMSGENFFASHVRT